MLDQLLEQFEIRNHLITRSGRDLALYGERNEGRAGAGRLDLVGWQRLPTHEL